MSFRLRVATEDCIPLVEFVGYFFISCDFPAAATVTLQPIKWTKINVADLRLTECRQGHLNSMGVKKLF